MSEAHKDAVTMDEPAAYLVRGIDSHNEEYASVWIKRQNADAAAQAIFGATITPLVEARAASPQAPAVDGAEAPAIGFRTRVPGFAWVPWLTDDQETIRRTVADALAHGSEAEALYAAPLTRVAAPIPMILHCPKCGTQHIDAQEPETFEAFDSGADIEYIRKPAWTNPPHRSHLCHSCGTIWRPADVATTGVASISTKGKDDNNAEPLTRVAATVTLTDGQIIEYGRSFPALLELLTREPARVAFTQCYRAMLAASPAAESKTLPRESEGAIAKLIEKHAELLDANPYAYFELAYTRQTGWMAWLTDRPAQGEPGTAAYAKSRKVIARGQGDTAVEACADAVALLDRADASGVVKGEAEVKKPIREPGYDIHGDRIG